MKSKPATKRLELRIPPHEMAIIDRYCAATGRTRADVLREFIRTLAPTPARPR